MSKPSQPRPQIATRLAGPADRERVDQLLGLFRQEFGYAMRGPCPPLDASTPLRVILAEHEGRTVGMMAAQLCHNLGEGSRFLLLSDIFVPAEHRQKGVAGAIMRHVKQLSSELDCHGMRLVVPDFNIAALTTAARSGFTRHDELMLSYVEDQGGGDAEGGA